MDGKEFNKFVEGLYTEKPNERNFDYEGYGVLDDLKLTKEQVRTAFGLMWNIVMEMESKERDEKYLFPKGLIKSKALFLEQKGMEGDMTESRKEILKEREVIFKEKLQNVKPLVDFLIKIREVI